MRSPVYGDSPRHDSSGYDDFPLDDEEKTSPIPPHHYTHHPQPSPSPPPFRPSHPSPPPSQPHAPLITSSPHSQPPLFTCTLPSISILLDLLSSLQIQKSTTNPTSPLLLHTAVLPSGLKFTVNRSKTLSARAYLKANLFTEWRLREGGEGLSFGVSLARFVHVLSVFGGDGVVVMTMEEGGDGVKLEMENDGVLCDCQLSCVVRDEDEDTLNFALHPVVARGSIASPTLRAAFTDMDMTGASSFTLLFSPVVPHLRLYTESEGVAVLAVLQSSVRGLSDVQSDPFIDFQFQGEGVLRLEYPAYLIGPSVVVLGLSEHTNVRVNEAGMLSMQHVVNTKMTDVNNWVEYVCAAMDEDGDGPAAGEKKWGERLFNEMIDLE